MGQLTLQRLLCLSKTSVYLLVHGLVFGHIVKLVAFLGLLLDLVALGRLANLGRGSLGNFDLEILYMQYKRS